jgi:hypothetical protein
MSEGVSAIRVVQREPATFLAAQAVRPGGLYHRISRRGHLSLWERGDEVPRRGGRIEVGGVCGELDDDG